MGERKREDSKIHWLTPFFDGWDSFFLAGPGTQLGIYSILSTNQYLSLDDRPLPQIGDIYTIGLFVKNSTGSGMSFQNHLDLYLGEYSGDTLNLDYLFKLDIGKDGSYEFSQVITADQMRSGFSTKAWTQQVADGFTGEYGIGTLEVISTDYDQDGLPNWWEEQYFGGATNAAPTATSSNGVNTHLQSYIAGLDPNDPTNTFSISMVPTNILQWSAVSGRVYSVHSTTNLTESFRPLETNRSWTCNSFTNSTDSPNAYFKIEVQLEE